MSDPVGFFYNQTVNREDERTAFAKRELPKTAHDVIFAKLIRERGPIQCGIAAYENWLDFIVPRQVKAKTVCDESGIYSFDNVRLRKPMYGGMPLFPYKARKSGLTYSGELIADIVRTPFDGGPSETISVECVLGKIPVVLGSTACHLYRYTSNQRKAVFEDSDDPLGYFIIRGSERVFINQENIAFSQQTTSKHEEKLETRITTHRVSGTTVVKAILGKKCPRVKISVQQSGMKGSSARPQYAVFAVFDALFQHSDPETYAYETFGSPSGDGGDGTSAGSAVQEEEASTTSTAKHTPLEIERIRVNILIKAHNLINQFIPIKHRKRVKYFLESSRAKYSTIRAPIADIVARKTVGAVESTIAQTALMSTSKRESSVYVSSKIKNPDTLARIVDVTKTLRTPDVEFNRESFVSIVMTDLFADLFPDAPIADKPVHLARIVARICLSAIGVRGLDNRDGWENKRIKMSSDLISQLFNGYFKVFLGKCGNMVVDTMLTDQFVSSFGTGGANNRDNMIHTIRRDTQISLFAQLSRLNTPSSRQSKHIAPRVIQDSQTGFICPAETPSGGACGLTKNLSTTTWVSLRRNCEDLIDDIVFPILNAVYPNGEFKAWNEVSTPHPVIIDGRIIAWCDGADVIDTFRASIKNRLEYFDITIIFNDIDGEVEMFTTGSRPCRPMFVVDEAGGGGLNADLYSDATLRTMSINDMITSRVIEYVSAAEQQYYYIVQNAAAVPAAIERRRTTPHPEGFPYLRMFSEIDPSAILGIAAAHMPLPETCQGPRVVYQAAMVAQSIGLYHDSYYAREDTSFKRAMSSRSTFEPRIAEAVGNTRTPTGRMFIVAFMSLANNGEDGVIANAQAFERVRMTKYTTHKITVKISPDIDTSGNIPMGVAFEKICRPREAMDTEAGTMRHSLYDAIGENGLPKIGSYLDKGSCIVGKVRSISSSDGTLNVTNASVFAGIGDEGTVDRVGVTRIYSDKTIIECGAGGCNSISTKIHPIGLIVRIRVRQVRPMMAGDKVASRYSQKGTFADFRSNITATASETVQSSAAIPASLIKAAAAAGSEAAERGVLRSAFVKRSTHIPTLEETEESMFSADKFRFARTLPRISSGPNKGVVPDIVINPAAIPSRMTIAFLEELFISKAALYTGDRVDASAFRSFGDNDIASTRATLAANGVNEDGYETMEHPDGSKLREGLGVFVGPCYYQLLMYTVKDKFQFRSLGAVVFLTNQPIGGRSREGGLRQGEMEKSAFCAHGASNLVRERLMRASDMFQFEICANCGNQAHSNASLGTRTCLSCSPEDTKIGIVETPFIHILISRMVMALGINSRMIRFKPVTQREI